MKQNFVGIFLTISFDTCKFIYILKSFSFCISQARLDWAKKWLSDKFKTLII